MSHLDEGQLHALLDGELIGAERSQAEEHLAGCPECRQALAEARAFFQEADALIAAVDLPPASAARPRVRPRGGFGWRQLAWAATVVLAVGLGWLAKSGQVTRTAGESTVAAAPAAVPAPERDSARLAEASPQGAAAENKAASESRKRPASVAPTMDKVAPKGEREAPAQPAPPVTEPAPAGAPSPAATLATRQAEAGRGNESGAIAPAPLDAPHEKALADAAQPEQARIDDAALESRRAAPVPSAAPTARAESLRGLTAPSASRPASSLHPVPMEEAVRILGGSIRLVDGMTPVRILAGEANPAGAQPPYSLVRVVYDDPPGRELWLDQQRPVETGGDSVVSGREAVALLPGDTVVVLMNHGSRGLRWLDQAGFRLGLTGFLPTDSLRALARRVQ